MIRHLAYLAPLAVLGLAACDGPAALTKAEDGDCFIVTGKEPGGAPKLEKTECAGAAVVTAPIEQPAEADAVDPATGQPVVAAAPNAQCPQVPVCPPAAVPAPRARAERSATRTARAKATRSRTGRTVVEEREYTRVYTPDYPPQPLLGAPMPPPPPMHHSYERSESYAYNPPASIMPPPPAQRYERRDEAYAYGRGYERSLPPPAPRRHKDGGYAYVPPPPPPPPPYVEGRGHRESYQSGGRYSRREEYSSSYSSSASSYSSSRYGAGYGCPNRCPPERPVAAPMNGPHFPVDQDGFLTWRGKTP